MILLKNAKLAKIFHAITIYVAKLYTMKDIKDRGEGYDI
jgi:hypothetical protein